MGGIRAVLLVAVAWFTSPSAGSANRGLLGNDREDCSIRIIESSEDTNAILKEQPALHFGKERAPALTIRVHDRIKYQTMDGFGATLTDCSDWLLCNKLSEERRKEALGLLFDPKSGTRLDENVAADDSGRTSSFSLQIFGALFCEVRACL